LRKSENEEAEAELFYLEGELDDLEEIKDVRFFADDCSSEALTSLLANNGGVFSVISTEGGIFDINLRFMTKESFALRGLASERR